MSLDSTAPSRPWTDSEIWYLPLMPDQPSEYCSSGGRLVRAGRAPEVGVAAQRAVSGCQNGPSFVNAVVSKCCRSRPSAATPTAGVMSSPLHRTSARYAQLRQFPLPRATRSGGRSSRFPRAVIGTRGQGISGCGGRRARRDGLRYEGAWRGCPRSEGRGRASWPGRNWVARAMPVTRSSIRSAPTAWVPCREGVRASPALNLEPLADQASY